MKQLFIYINPAKRFGNSDWKDEPDVLVKVQIDNSLALGWSIDDIILVTNFEYEYNGVKAVIVGDENYCEHSSGTPSKINVICDMFNKGMIGDDLYWFHDFDAFQLEPFTKEELDLPPGKIALTDYGYIRGTKSILSRWSTGSIFFDKGCKDIFEWIKASVYKYTANEEVSLLVMTRHNDHDLLNRIKKLNITWNLATRRRNVELCYRDADKPIKILHFHPNDVRITSTGHNNIETCIYGKNWMGRPLIPDRLIKIFGDHNIK